VSGVVVRTDTSGFFRFPDGCDSSVSLTGGINVDTTLPFTGTLKAPAGSKMVTPLTTLLVGGMTQEQINASLGLPEGTDLTNTDPALTSAGVLINADLFKRTLAVQQFAQKLTETFAGLAASGGDAAKAAIYSEVAVAMAQALAANSAFVSGGTISESVATAVSKAAIERVKAATTLPAAVILGVSGLNSDSFAQVVAGALKFQADAILSAADSSSSVTSTTKTQQQNTAITTFIQTNKADLTGVPTDATAALGEQLTQALTGTPGTGNANNLLTNGDFSNGTTGWSGNAANVQTEGGNSFNLANVTAAGNAYDVNLSYVLDIPNSGVGYKLRFKASSDRSRTMVAGIGLNQDPWTNVTEVVSLTTTQQTFELSLTSNFASLTSRVIFDMGAAVGTVVIDDVELVLDTPTTPAPTGGPTAAAAAPTASAANVKSIFSDSYTNVAVNEWGPNWGDASARITDGAIASNNYKTIDMSAGQEFAGISFVSSKFDATTYTTFNVDYWVDTPLLAGQVINIKLSNHDGSAETNAIQYLVNPVTAGSWQRLSIPLSSFTVAGGGSASRNNIAQIIITAARANVSTTSVKVYFDNMYFSQ
jgi:endoglucanase